MKKILFILMITATTAVLAKTDTAWQLSPDAYGPIHIGMTSANLTKVTEKRLGPASDGMVPPHELIAGHCDYFKFIDGPTNVRFMLKKGAIVRIEVTNTHVVSDKGIHVGDTEKKLKAAYKNQLTQVEGNFLLYLPKHNDYGQMFEIGDVNGKMQVISITSGKLPALKYGC